MKVSVELRAGAGPDSACPVRLVLVAHRQRARMGIGHSVNPKAWDKRRQRMRNGHRNADLVNARIDELVLRAERLALQMPHCTPDQMKKLLTDRPAGGTFHEMALDDLDRRPPASYHTRKQRQAAARRFGEWAVTVGLQDMSATIMQEYKHYLLAERGVAYNTMAAQLRMLRTMYRRLCKQVAHSPKDILDGCDAVHRQGRSPSRLTAEEVKKLMAYAESVKGWKAKSVHMWLFSFFSAGVRWMDLCLLREENLADGRLRYVQHKTRKHKDVELHPVAARIARIYCTNGFVFNVARGEQPSESRMEACNVVANRNLKLAAAACGIAKRMHTHNARHSFADQAMEADLDDRAIQAALAIDAKAYIYYKGQLRPGKVDQGVRMVLQVYDDAHATDQG